MNEIIAESNILTDAKHMDKRTTSVHKAPHFRSLSGLFIVRNFPFTFCKKNYFITRIRNLLIINLFFTVAIKTCHHANHPNNIH